MHKNHSLRDVGVKTDDKVFGGYVFKNEVTEIDRGRMSPEKFTVRTALTNYLRTQMGACGIKFRAHASNQHQMLKVA